MWRAKHWRRFSSAARPEDNGAANAQSLREPRGGAAIANGARDGSELADASADAEVIGVDHFAVLLDLFAFEADVGDPVLSAAIGAAGDVHAKLLIEPRDAFVEFIHEPAGKALGLGDGKFAELGAGAGDGTAPEVGSLHVQANLAEFAQQFAGFAVRNVHEDKILQTVARSWPSPKRSERSAAAQTVRLSGGRAGRWRRRS